MILRFSGRGGIYEGYVYLVKDIYKLPHFRCVERRRPIGRLFNPRYRGNDKGDELRLDSKVCEVLRNDGGGPWRRVLLDYTQGVGDLDSLWETWIGPADIPILVPIRG